MALKTSCSSSSRHAVEEGGGDAKGAARAASAIRAFFAGGHFGAGVMREETRGGAGTCEWKPGT